MDREMVALEDLRRILASCTSRYYTLESRPDQQNRTRNRVDFLLRANGSRPLAVEHATIETFTDQIGGSHRSVRFVERVHAQVRGRLPTARYYELLVPLPMPSAASCRAS